MSPEDHDLLIRMDATLTEMKNTLETLVPQVAQLQTDRTTNATNIANLREDVRDLENKRSLFDAAIGMFSLAAAGLAAFVGFSR